MYCGEHEFGSTVHTLFGWSMRAGHRWRVPNLKEGVSQNKSGILTNVGAQQLAERRS
jgi:hypothetical protein